MADSVSVKRAALAMGPWEASAVTRAALLVALRPSERDRLRLSGAGLRAMLGAAVDCWQRNRAPDGFAAGLFVATSVGPPATQGRLNAFYTAGMHGGGAESADEAAQALENILSASDPSTKKTMRMVLFPKVATREGALALATEVVCVRLARIADVDWAMDDRARALWAAYLVAYPNLAGCEPIAIRLRTAAMHAARLTQFDAGKILVSLAACDAFVWPFAADPFVLVAATPAGRPRLLKVLGSAVVRGIQAVSKAWVPGKLSHYVIVHRSVVTDTSTHPLRRPR